MPTETLAISATGALTGWNIGAGSRPSCVQSDDGDTSFLTRAATIAVRDTYLIANMVGSGSVIDVFRIYWKAKWQGGSDGCPLKFFARISGVNGSDSTNQNLTTSYALYSKTDFGRPGGGNWVPTDFKASTLEIGVSNNGTGGTNDSRVTYGYGEADYRSPGAFAHLVDQWLPPLLAVASHALMKREIVAILSRLKTRPADREDFALIFEAFRRRPVFLI